MVLHPSVSLFRWAPATLRRGDGLEASDHEGIVSPTPGIPHQSIGGESTVEKRGLAPPKGPHEHDDRDDHHEQRHDDPDVDGDEKWRFAGLLHFGRMVAQPPETIPTAAPRQRPTLLRLDCPASRGYVCRL